MATLIIGCGYVGRRVAERLRDRGESVLTTTRSQARAEELRLAGFDPIVLDVLQPDPLRTIRGVDRTLFCVGYDRSSDVPLERIHVEGLSRILAAGEDRLGRLVYTSSTGVYGQSDGEWVDEDSPTDPRERSGRAILAAERLALAWGEPGERSVTVVRFSGLYGPGRIIRRDALLRQEPIGGDPSQFLNLIHQEDAATALLLALDSPQGNPLFLASDDEPITRRDYYEWTARCLGAPAPRFVIDEGTDHPAATSANKRINAQRIRRVLGFQPIYPSIRTGIPAALEAEARASGATSAE
ncbi:MAG: SDR family oxidoreductase [Isosphaeraceae bacterium]